MFSVAILLGLFLGVVYAVFKVFLTNTVQSEEDIKAETAMPILGKIPYFKTKNNLVVQQGNRTVIGEMFRQLRAEIQYALTTKNAEWTE